MFVTAILLNKYAVITLSWMVRFGQNLTDRCRMTCRRWSKLEVEFQHGGRSFSETGSNNILALDWDISPKFGPRVDIDHPNWTKSRKTKPEVEMWCRNRHLENRYDVKTRLWVSQFGLNLVRCCRVLWRWCSEDENRNRQ